MIKKKKKKRERREEGRNRDEKRLHRLRP
jgi:hypothetical protein